ncbi:MAG TPA: hypothetical protein EYP85_10170 [Armatimonadetes bacterium]|nr:hypothetical protein [Armatimonadota bacterium]
MSGSLVWAWALGGLVLGSAGGGAKEACIRIDVHAERGPVNRLVWGNNMLGYQYEAWEHTRPEYSDRGAGIWDPERRRPVPELVALAKQAGLSVSRWPGGCGTHRFDWKKTVGPLEGRPRQKFGLPEFLQHCAAIGAEPIITVSAFLPSPADLADLVEYCNAPLGGSNPNGGVDWAALRANDGHPEPWNVIWFEYGNETDHGDHRGHKWTPQEYATRFIAARRAMKAVDPRIKLGAVLQNTVTPNFGPWTRTVLKETAPHLDFVIHHCYLPRYRRNDGVPDAETLFRLGLAGYEQMYEHYRKLNALIRELTGREDIPLAITEFNGHFVQEKPVPYRLCLGNALINAEFLRLFMQPELNIARANFWQFSNEYWGMIKGYEPPYVKRPNYYVFQLYREHFGEVLLKAEVECPTYETEGGYGIRPRQGQPREFHLFPENVLPPQEWKLTPVEGVRQRVEEGVLVVDLETDEDLNYYHATMRLPAEPNLGYRLTGWVRCEGLRSAQGPRFQIGDGRGWEATHSAALTPDVVTGTSEWVEVSCDYVTLPDAQDLLIHARRLGGGGGRGRLFFRGVKVQRFIPQNYGAVPVLGVNTSRSGDGRTVFAMVVNKALEGPLSTRLELVGAEVASARAWSLTGPRVDATNEADPYSVTVREWPLAVTNGTATIELPPHSLTAVELTVEQ